jgi:hypothetical protein
VRTAARSAWAVAPILIAGLMHVAVLKADILPQLAAPLTVMLAGGAVRCWVKTRRGGDFL